MAEAFPVSVPLNKQEYEVVERLAKRKGVTVDEMATALVQAAIEKRVRRRTGKGPARVYGFKRK